MQKCQISHFWRHWQFPHPLPIYRLAVHPLYNPQLLAAAYQPLSDHLNTQLPNARLELEASRDYQAFEKKYAAREPAFLLPNPWQTLQAIPRGYHVITMAGDTRDFNRDCSLGREGVAWRVAWRVARQFGHW